MGFGLDMGKTDIVNTDTASHTVTCIVPTVVLFLGGGVGISCAPPSGAVITSNIKLLKSFQLL